MEILKKTKDQNKPNTYLVLNDYEVKVLQELNHNVYKSGKLVLVKLLTDEANKIYFDLYNLPKVKKVKKSIFTLYGLDYIFYGDINKINQ